MAQAGTSEIDRLQWGSLRDWGQLVRLPNVFTLLSDCVVATVVAAHLAWPVTAFIPVVVASLCAYWAGMILNDVVDLDEDRESRPDRPLVSGKISVALAGHVANGLLLLGPLIILAVMTFHTSQPIWLGIAFLASVLLSLAIRGYDSPIKRTPLGPPLMGMCRALNILMVGFSMLAVSGTGDEAIPSEPPPLAQRGHALLLISNRSSTSDRGFGNGLLNQIPNNQSSVETYRPADKFRSDPIPAEDPASAQGVPGGMGTAGPDTPGTDSAGTTDLPLTIPAADPLNAGDSISKPAGRASALHSLPNEIFPKPLLALAAGIGIYIFGVTVYARREEKESSPAGLVLGILLEVVGLVIIGCLPMWAAEDQPWTLNPRQGYPLLITLIGATVVNRGLAGVRHPVPRKVQLAVKHAILTLILIDAAVVLMWAGAWYGMLVVALLLPALSSAIRFRST